MLLILCDLNGFKAYNDTFGHPAGDALLARLGAALARDIDAHGRAYRIGGDEFCILARPGRAGIEPIIAIAARALSEHGEGFSITTSQGAVLLPADASTATEAMRAVDLRMYENKNSSRVPADAQTINALLRTIHERDPQWAERLVSTADLAGAVCQQLGIPVAEAARIRQAAQLHDIGKVGIPDEILRKPGRLTPQEWAFIQQAPSIGERIALSAPALVAVAPAGPLGPGTLRRHRLPRRPGRRRHPARRPNHRRLRRAGRHDLRPALRRPARHPPPPWRNSTGPPPPNTTRQSSPHSIKPCSNRPDGRQRGRLGRMSYTWRPSGHRSDTSRPVPRRKVRRRSTAGIHGGRAPLTRRWAAWKPRNLGCGSGRGRSQAGADIFVCHEETAKSRTPIVSLSRAGRHDVADRRRQQR